MERNSISDWRSTRANNERRCERILHMAAPLEVEDLRWDDVGKVPVAPAVIDTLTYMRDVEGFTDSYLTGIAAHRTTLGDPLIGPFLRVWQAEEAGHSQALAKYLALYGARRELAIPAQQPSPRIRPPAHERLVSQVGGTAGRLVVAAHMTWGAANELLTLNGYRLLADRCNEPILAELLSRIAAQESRHYSFYLLQAEWRLAHSRLARAVLPRLLGGSWTPVGVGDGYKSADEFRRVLAYLGVGHDGERAIDRMDRRMRSLPGLENLRIYRDAATMAAA